MKSLQRLRRRLRCVLLVVAAMGSFDAVADLPAAFKAFRELAELGQPLAQRNIAVMYMRGEGAEKNLTQAYAWASLAVESGAEDAARMVAKIGPQLSPADLKAAAGIQADFNRQALEKRLMPQFVDERKPDAGTCILRRSAVEYPSAAIRSGLQGSVMVEFTVMPDGRARMPRIIHALPLGAFDESVRSGVLRSTYVPGRFAGVTAPCLQTIYFRFEMSYGSTSRNPKLDKLVRETLAQAESGDVTAQMLYGMLVSGLPQLKKERSEALPWFLKAAQAGAPLAQYQVGFSILNGWGCLCEEPKGLVWLRKAAAADQPDAQLTLAQFALRDSSGDGNIARAKNWLERAASRDHRDAKLYLAALLASAPLAGARDPQRSLALLDVIKRDRDPDPTALEIRAAAQAASGDFPAAVKNQKRAVAAAKWLGWDLAPHNERLARYQANEPWYGNLLPF